jgi:hypothetical protein
MILGPDDPRAVTGAELEAARKNTERWNELLGIAPMTKTQRERYEADLNAVLDFLNSADEQIICEHGNDIVAHGCRECVDEFADDDVRHDLIKRGES